MSVNLNVSAMKYKDPSTGQYKDVAGVLSPVQDVQVNGTSILDAQGVANVPVAGSDFGVVKVNSSYGIKITSGGTLQTNYADSNGIKVGTSQYAPIVPYMQHASAFYGLAKAAGDSTQSASSNPVGTYTDDAKAAIRTMLGAGDVTDVQLNGASVVQNGVANVPIAGVDGDTPILGVVAVNPVYGIKRNANNGLLQLSTASINECKTQTGALDYRPITVYVQHASAFYGLAKAAGDTTQSESSNAVGQYTESAKSAISEMLNGSVEVSGTTPTINALPGIRYVCGEVATIDITVPASGIIDVVFTSGSTPAVLTATGVTWPEWFDPTTLEANRTYEISIADGFGAVMSWA